MLRSRDSHRRIFAIKKSRFTDSQIIEVLKRAEAGLVAAGLCRELDELGNVLQVARHGASLMVHLKELEEENRRLRKMYVKKELKAEIISESFAKSGETISPTRDGASSDAAARTFDSVCVPGRSAKPATAMRPPATPRTTKLLFGCCACLITTAIGLRVVLFLHLPKVRCFAWNHKGVYRIYRELELNLRVKPCKRLARGKPEPLTAPKTCNEVWSMDFCMTNLKTGAASGRST